VRAPNIQELFATPQTVLVSVIDTVTGTQNQILQVTGGNPQLKPEKADTTTVGMVFQPRGGALDGLQFSVDYYDIDVLNAIDVIDPQSLISLCAAGSAVACQSVKRNALGQLVMITGNTTNLTSVRTSGLEFAADYLLPLSRISASLPGELQLRADATHVYKLQSKDPNGLSIDRVGNTTSTISSTSASNSEGVPDWNVNLVANYSWNPWSFTLQGRFISASIYDPRLLGPDQPGYNPAALNSISNNHIPSAFYLNAGAQFDLSKAVQLYAFVDNLLDRDPPAIPLFSTGAYYDTIGRRYRVGVRANF
jgi:outer membrane receptor protein involved in Fe transport